MYLLRKDRYGMIGPRVNPGLALSPSWKTRFPSPLPSTPPFTIDFTEQLSADTDQCVDGNSLAIQPPVNTSTLPCTAEEENCLMLRCEDFAENINSCEVTASAFGLDSGVLINEDEADAYYQSTQYQELAVTLADISSSPNQHRYIPSGPEQRPSLERSINNVPPLPETVNPALLSICHDQVLSDPSYDRSELSTSQTGGHDFDELNDESFRSRVEQLSPFRHTEITERTAAVTPVPMETSSSGSRMTLGSPMVCAKPPKTLEEIMHNKHRDRIMVYRKEILKEATRSPSSSELTLRAKWLTEATEWARIFTRSKGKLPAGGAQCSNQADVLYFTSDDFLNAASRHETFDKPIVIKESFSDSGMHTTESLVAQLTDACSKATIDVAWLDQESPETVSIHRLVDCVQSDSSHVNCGANVLNLQNYTKAHRPLLTMLPRFRLLESLVERARGDSAGKRKDSLPANGSGSIGFNLFSTAGAFSGPHVYALSGAWVRNLEGITFWMIMSNSDNELDWDQFAKLGRAWIPKVAFKLIVLEQDDVLLMPAGTKVVHAVHSPINSVMEGGMLWDDLSVLSTLQAISWIMKHRRTANEAMPKQLPRIIDELTSLVRSQPDRFRGRLSRKEFLHDFAEATSSLRSFGCRCGPYNCGATCRCRIEERRCMSWCTAHFEEGQMACMDEPIAGNQESSSIGNYLSSVGDSEGETIDVNDDDD